MIYSPKSSHIKSFDYSPELRQLKVAFATNKKIYTHQGFPPEAWAALQRFPSAGKYYHRFVKDRYKMLTAGV